MKRRRVEAWAVVDFENVITAGPMAKRKHATDIARDFPEAGERVVKLVEHNPAADAVVRAALKWFYADDFDGEVTPDLFRAIERLEKGRK